MENFKKKKKAFIIVGIIIAVIAAGAAAVAIIANRNVNAMNKTIDDALKIIQSNYSMTQIEEDEYNELTVYGIMKFDVDHYWIEGVGNLSVMKVNMGVMQMATFVITPCDKNLPLMSVDYMYMLTNRKSYIEFYDLVETKDDTYIEYMKNFEDIKDSYNDLKDFSPSEAWYEPLITVATYKNSGSGDDNRTSLMLAENLTAYLKMANNYPLMSADEKAEKREIIQSYSDGLITNGGVSTDVFKSSLGTETTKDFFDKVFFGTALFK